MAPIWRVLWGMFASYRWSSAGRQNNRRCASPFLSLSLFLSRHISFSLTSILFNITRWKPAFAPPLSSIYKYYSLPAYTALPMCYIHTTFGCTSYSYIYIFPIQHTQPPHHPSPHHANRYLLNLLHLLRLWRGIIYDNLMGVCVFYGSSI